MNNTAMNFNSSLFDPNHKIPDDHFEEAMREDDIESRDCNLDDQQSLKRDRTPTIIEPATQT